MKKLILIDANSIIHRAYHALPPLTSFDKKPVGALYGLANILLKILNEQKPDYLAACFDRPEPTFRKKIYEAYKAQRPKAPEDLVFQIKEAYELFKVLEIKIFEKAGYEADDLIGTLTENFKKIPDLQIIILTGDLDALQLVEDDKIIVKTFKKGVSELKIYNEKEVFQRYQLKPWQIPDYKSLAGDYSDNIKGIKGIGLKTASQLLNQFHNIESLIENLEKNPKINLKIKSEILNQKEQLKTFKKLATINKNVPLTKITIEDLKYILPSLEEVIKYFKKLGFESLIKRLNQQEKTPIVHQSQLILINNQKTEKNLNPYSSPKEKKILNELLNDPEKLKIAAWLVDPDQKNLDFNELNKKFLNKENASFEELGREIFKKIKEYDLIFILENIELPLFSILKKIEKNGLRINKQKIKILNKKAENELLKIEKEIYKLAQEEFNLNSPKQIARILEKLEINTPALKTSSGFKSTAEKFLFKIKNHHQIIDLILKYRETFKIKTTYLESLIKKIDPSNQKIYTHLNQTGSATGRIISEKPNLQNIPQGTRWALALRDVFESSQNHFLVSFDYSQIELRIIASLAEEDLMLEAFSKNLDIHQLTASEIFKIPFGQVDKNKRRFGKILNFSLIYGIGPQNLAQQANISFKEAKEFIEKYFKKFPKIKIWQEKIKEKAYQQGYVKNVLGRIRWFPFINFQNPKLKAESERAVINTPIQSLSADIIKLAIIKINHYLEESKIEDKTKIILLIHDELLFEIKNDIFKKTAPNIKDIMENIFNLKAPLKVEIKYGSTWKKLKPF